ncbi:MAG TPA: D-alanyl-D-alanine carboxypeptidase/D-alanyl-D-alanine-endopeptidase [Blastocatellia bacterium]|nr:D-alanyl-D-alanine carboxypeptidase/D-alanyl-D-alanine-endopeptidase [Blastocatellia bacterium]
MIKAKSSLVFALAFFYAVAPAVAYSQSLAAQPVDTVDSLRARIYAHLAQPRFNPAAWGVKIVSLDTGATIFEQNAGKYFSPASNAKLYSAALALDRLGGDYRIKTSLYATARPDASGRIKGDLIVYGRGDPTLAARLNGGDYYKPFEPFLNLLVNAGVRKIEGDLIGDESYFAGPPFGSGWGWDDLQWYYGAEVSALSINDNALDLFVKPAERAGLPCQITTGPPTAFVTIMNRTQTAPKGEPSRVSVYRPVGENIIYVSGRLALGDRPYSGSVAVHDPAALFVTLFKQLLAERGIAVTGRVRTIDWKYREVTPIDFTKLVDLGAVESLPVKDIVRETLKPSQNLYAQLLLLQVGAARSTPQPASNPYRTTESAGIDEMNGFLSEVGIKRGEVILEEGSGLSRKDLITPSATVELLKYMSRHRWADAFREGLPVAGVDGTLEKRMKETPAEGNARAKTGSLRYVYTLSGYVTTAAGERLAFSILLNNSYNADRSISPRDDIDAIVVMLAGFSSQITNHKSQI